MKQSLPHYFKQARSLVNPLPLPSDFTPDWGKVRADDHFWRERLVF